MTPPNLNPQLGPSNPVDNTPEPKHPLREMQFSDILDTTFSLYRAHFRLFAGITAVLYLFISLITVPFFLLYGIAISDSSAGSLLLFILLAIAFMYIFAKGISALVFAVAQVYLGQKTTIREAFRRSQFVPILGASLLMGLVAGALYITLIGIPFAVYFMVRWSLFCQGIMVEGLRATRALSRSSELIKGSWWRVFGTEIVLWMLSSLIQMILSFGLMFGSVFLSRVEGIAQLIGLVGMLIMYIIVPIFTTPIAFIGITLLYFNLRIRKEAFDIEMMAKGIHGQA